MQPTGYLVWGRVCGGLAGGGSFPPLGACVGIEGFWGESRSVEAARERARLLQHMQVTALSMGEAQTENIIGGYTPAQPTC